MIAIKVFPIVIKNNKDKRLICVWGYFYFNITGYKNKEKIASLSLAVTNEGLPMRLRHYLSISYKNTLKPMKKISYYVYIKQKRQELSFLPKLSKSEDYTQPVGLGRPAILQAPLPGPDGNNS